MIGATDHLALTDGSHLHCKLILSPLSGVPVPGKFESKLLRKDWDNAMHFAVYDRIFCAFLAIMINCIHERWQVLLTKDYLALLVAITERKARLITIFLGQTKKPVRLKFATQ
ncbi:hypothetical protein GA0070617_5668 [Micromonospora yangpuensis]|uniref:Uncharacterized protein n=1 Tax=Micromonospora yangpuensis TaxID=683228 RepID=A0A1C6VGV7_9ACTN|nr:hypothetical protein GA0070617_5668 [Micromonospora yangpuensis]